jgi:uncharacterized membrane protein
MIVHTLFPFSDIGGPVSTWIEIASLAIEILAVAIISTVVLFSTMRYIYQVARAHGSSIERYEAYRHSLARSLLLGLEILVAADIVRTVALEPTLTNVASLGLLVVIRVILGWSLMVEIEGRWPWQPANKPEKTEQ